MKRIFILIAFFIAISAQAQTVKVAAAANLRFVFEEIKASYAIANPKTTVTANFGSSGALLQQIMNGAEFDIFMAADNTFPEKLKDQGAASGEIKTYALGKLVMWSNTVDVSKGLDMLTDPSVKRIAIAKPELAPYGDRAIEVLKAAGLYDKVKDKIIYADNISQTAQFAQTGNAEVAFLAMSLTLTPEMKGSVYLVDPKLYKPVEQAMVLVKRWKTNPEAAKFMKFVLSEACKPIFEKNGYIVP
ncbi:MAG: molybdate ABC transporter substrate-binding protein [Prolixibacteraceae bacterium]|nr:molybdate ABC transporter substrate-binding protein [Prolixibacteraceae bacterium]